MRRTLQTLRVMGLSALLTGAAYADSGDFGTTAVKSPNRAEFNWMMNCQGCHGVKGEGSPGGAPVLTGVVTKFLSVEGGRAYLARVPGVANAPLDDEELSDLLNWMLDRFSCEAVPSDFSAYKADEIARYRKDSLITNAHEVRAALVSEFETPADGTTAGSMTNREGQPCLRQ